MTIDELTKDYMALRIERERLASEFKSKDEALKIAQSNIEAKLIDICNEQNMDSVRTVFGTVIRSIKQRVHVLDWESFYGYIVENNAPQLLHKRVHESNFEEFMQERQKDGLPPGVNVVREYQIVVRKPSKVESNAVELV